MSVELGEALGGGGVGVLGECTGALRVVSEGAWLGRRAEFLEEGSRLVEEWAEKACKGEGCGLSLALEEAWRREGKGTSLFELAGMLLSLHDRVVALEERDEDVGEEEQARARRLVRVLEETTVRALEGAWR